MLSWATSSPGLKPGGLEGKTWQDRTLERKAWQQQDNLVGWGIEVKGQQPRGCDNRHWLVRDLGCKALEDRVVQLRASGGKELGIRALEGKTSDYRAKED